MSKQKELFSLLMQTLSRHLRPAPYQYGLLTVRLLGKLGGRNRQFLRDPMPIVSEEQLRPQYHVKIDCKFKSSHGSKLQIPVSLGECVSTIKSISRCEPQKLSTTDGMDTSPDCAWDRKFDVPSIEMESHRIARTIRNDQLMACWKIVRQGATDALGAGQGMECRDRLTIDGLLYLSLLPTLQDECFELLSKLLGKVDCKVLGDGITRFAAEQNPRCLTITMEVFNNWNKLAEAEKLSSLNGALISSLCEFCCMSTWSRRIGPQAMLCHVVKTLGYDFAKIYEETIFTAAFVPLKNTPKELARASVIAWRSFVELATTFYGNSWCHSTQEQPEVEWDTAFPEANNAEDIPKPTVRPSKTVFRLVLKELAAPQQLARFVTYSYN